MADVRVTRITIENSGLPDRMIGMVIFATKPARINYNNITK